MSTFTFDDLSDIMRQVDADSGAGLTDAALDRTFDELDFDSLAVLEIATHIQQTTGLAIPDEAVAEMTTPRAALEYVNQHLASV